VHSTHIAFAPYSCFKLITVYIFSRSLLICVLQALDIPYVSQRGCSCMSASLRLKISDTNGDIGLVPIKSLQEVAQGE